MALKKKTNTGSDSKYSQKSGLREGFTAPVFPILSKLFSLSKALKLPWNYILKHNMQL